MSVEVKSKDIKKAQQISKKRDKTTADEHPSKQKYSGVSTEAKVNLTCCPVIYLYESDNDRALIPSAPPPPYEC